MLGLLSSIVITMMLGGNVLNSNVHAAKCEDIKGTMKWNGEGHDDNNPSEKKFFKALDEKTFCEVNKDIDHMKIKGEIKEDTKHDFDWLKETMYYQSVDEEAQHKLWESYSESPDDDGDKNLADYEMVESAY